MTQLTKVGQLNLKKFLNENNGEKFKVSVDKEDHTFIVNNYAVDAGDPRKYDRLDEEEGKEYYMYVRGTNLEIKEFYRMLVDSDNCTSTNFGGMSLRAIQLYQS